MVSLWPSGLCKYILHMQEIHSSNFPVVTEICDPNKSQARHHRSKIILLNILQNVVIYLIFCFAYYGNFWKWYISILQDKLNFLVLHNFTKCFSDTRVNQIANALVLSCLVLSFCCFRFCKKWCFQITTLYLFASFNTAILCSVHPKWFVKYVLC